jgi:hypothetical protein
VPEIDDFKSRAKTIAAFGDFSTIDFTLIGLGESRTVKAGVVSGSYFDVMGLRPVLGRLLNSSDDGPNAPGAAVLTYRFWTTALESDRSLVGRTITLGALSAKIVGVLEPSCAVSCRHRNHRERRHQPASPRRHDGHSSARIA